MVATGNVGCILQIARQVKQSGRPIRVVHPVDLLDLAYRGGAVRRPRTAGGLAMKTETLYVILNQFGKSWVVKDQAIEPASLNDLLADGWRPVRETPFASDGDPDFARRS